MNNLHEKLTNITDNANACMSTKSSVTHTYENQMNLNKFNGSMEQQQQQGRDSLLSIQQKQQQLQQNDDNINFPLENQSTSSITSIDTTNQLNSSFSSPSLLTTLTKNDVQLSLNHQNSLHSENMSLSMEGNLNCENQYSVDGIHRANKPPFELTPVIEEKPTDFNIQYNDCVSMTDRCNDNHNNNPMKHTSQNSNSEETCITLVQNDQSLLSDQLYVADRIKQKTAGLNDGKYQQVCISPFFIG
ncbi:unnamed protein product [Trichobilharzia szidati]|nr:unnamed protein product [Trichobilharzia szidati]